MFQVRDIVELTEDFFSDSSKESARKGTRCIVTTIKDLPFGFRAVWVKFPNGVEKQISTGWLKRVASVVDSVTTK